MGKAIGQEERLNKLVKKNIVIAIITVIGLIFLMVVNIMVVKSYNRQIEVTNALNQYRLGSKELTYAIQSYAVSGDKIYYDNYMKELNQTKSRDKALATLKECGLETSEWNMLNQISDLSESLIPLENAAMESVANGNLDAAVRSVFSQEYENIVVELNETTSATIETIQTRMTDEQKILSVLQYISEGVFIVMTGLVLWNVLIIVQFSKAELLIPIKKTCEQMLSLSKGDFQSKLDMHVDESEVGVMVGAIFKMKEKTYDIITEISDTLEQMGNGDYQIQVNADYVGDYGKIKDSFLIIGEKMRDTFRTLKDVTKQIESGSDQLASAAQDLAEGCTVQATQVSEVLSAMGEMSQSMESNAQEAITSIELSAKASETLMEGNKKMGELISAIEEINKHIIDGFHYHTCHSIIHSR